MNAAAEIRDDAHKDPETLKQEIDATRADVGETLDRLQAKLSPGQLLDQTLGLVQRHGGEMAANLGNAVKQNPVPMLLTSVGLAWLMASGASGRSTASRERSAAEWDGADAGGEWGSAASAAAQSAGETVGEAARRAGDAAASARERVSAAASSASDAMHRAGSTTRDQAIRAREGFNRMLEEQPLLLGILGIALGAAVGAALPHTRQEDEWLGPARDQALHRAKSATAEQMDEVRSAARQTH